MAPGHSGLRAPAARDISAPAEAWGTTPPQLWREGAPAAAEPKKPRLMAWPFLASGKPEGGCCLKTAVGLKHGYAVFLGILGIRGRGRENKNVIFPLGSLELQKLLYLESSPPKEIASAKLDCTHTGAKARCWLMRLSQTKMEPRQLNPNE